MATRKRGAIVISGDIQEEGATQATAAPHQGVKSDELDPDIESLLDEIGEAGGAAVLWREKDAQPGNFDYLMRIPAKGFTLEYVRENYGGGNYKIVPVDPQHGALNPSFFSIDRRWTGKAFSNGAVAAAPQQDHFQQFQLRMLEVMMTAMVANRQQPVVQQDSAKTTVELIAALAPLMRGGDGANAGELVKSVVEMATMLATSMNPPEGLSGVVAGLLPSIDKLASAHQLSARRAAVAHVLPPATKTAPVSQPVTVVTQPTAQTSQPATVAGSIFPKWLEPFRDLAPRLISLADKDADPELYADLVIDALTDEENEAALHGAIEAMQNNTMEADALLAVPAMSAKPERLEWLRKFVEAVAVGLRDLLAQETDTSDAVQA